MNMETISILQKLISIKSFSGQEEMIQKFIFKYIKTYNLKPFFVGKNVVVKIKGANSKVAVIFNSHSDTVSVGNLAAWKADPFNGHIIKNKVFGLGASDEKASIAVTLKLIEIFSKKKPACDLWITFVVNEEVDGSGTKDFVEWFADNHQEEYKKISGILGEPTCLSSIEIGHKGNIFIKMTAAGDSGHGSQPTKIKKHAIKITYKLIAALEKEGKSWSKKYKNEFLGIPTISLTSIAGGDISSPNKFPDTCVASFDVRTTPEVHEKAFGLIKLAAKDVDSEITIEYLFPPAPFGYTDKESEIVKIAQKITNAGISSSFGSNDMCFLTQAGIPAIVLGAGEHSCIHKPNEYCLIENLDKCVSIYQKIIEKYGAYQ